jgi:phosphonate transport system permease protein
VTGGISDYGLRVRKDARGVPRFEAPGALSFMLMVLVLAFVVWSFNEAAPEWERLSKGASRLFAPSGMLRQMFPPDLSRLGKVSWSLLQTFQMAVAGCVLGILLSLPLAILAAEGLSPHPIVRFLARGLIGVFRTVPDLVWAIIFIIVVGLGPAAGVLAIMIDTTGFAGRFFAESMEETDKGPREALSAIGASRTGLIFSAVIPQALPAFVATSLFSLEKSVRGSVALGLVGAGGVGMELKIAFDLIDYDHALTIIILMFLLVFAVEQVSSWARRRLI